MNRMSRFSRFCQISSGTFSRSISSVVSHGQQFACDRGDGGHAVGQAADRVFERIAHQSAVSEMFVTTPVQPLEPDQQFGPRGCGDHIVVGFAHAVVDASQVDGRIVLEHHLRVESRAEPRITLQQLLHLVRGNRPG